MHHFRKHQLAICFAMALAVLLLPAVTIAQGPPHDDLPDPSFDFNTFFVTWVGVDNPKLVEYVKQAKPEIVQVGFYGPMFHGYADYPESKGYPMRLPAVGQHEALEAQKQLIDQLHAEGAKVIGHFQMVNVISTWEEQTHFVEMYNKRWPEDLLGPKPHHDVTKLLQRDGDGNVITQAHYVDYVGLCLSSPHAIKMLKAMLKVAIDNGVDGIMSNYNYRWGCVCEYCQAAFKSYLSARYSEAELKTRFAIDDIETYAFDRIYGKIPGYPAEDAPAIDFEAMRFSAIKFKEAFDEVLIDYGRSLKPDLIVATWNHVGGLDLSEERAFLPAEMWGKGENYFWYSGAHAGKKIADGYVGDGWLIALYIRELSSGKPFMLGKYEQVRMRAAIAEGVATGGAGMGLYMKFADDAGFKHGVQYTTWIRDNQPLYTDVDPVADIAVVLPRQSLQAGHRESLDAFKNVAQTLIDQQWLIDVVADHNLTFDRLQQYPAVVVPAAYVMSTDQLDSLTAYQKQGGKLVLLGRIGKYDEAGNQRDQLFTGSGLMNIRSSGWQIRMGNAYATDKLDESNATQQLAGMLGIRRSVIDGPVTLRAAAYRTGSSMQVHLVNFNRDEHAAEALDRKEKTSPAAELPIAEELINITLHLPNDADGAKVKQVRLLSPDADGPTQLEFKQAGRHVAVTVPRILIYGVVDVQWE